MYLIAKRLLVLLALGATLVACGEDEKTFGGGFHSHAECVDGYKTLDPSLSAPEREQKCRDLASGKDTDPNPGGSGGDSRDSEPELLTCPESLEVIAERRGGGFVEGVDPEYDSRMDWDGDGVSCE